jgi:phage terminase large subunit
VPPKRFNERLQLRRQAERVVEAPFGATRRQLDLAKAWKDPSVRRLLAHGAVRSGKTQAAARLLVEAAMEFPGTQYLVARQSYTALSDTIQRAIMHGDGPLPPLAPAEALLGNSVRTAYVGGNRKALTFKNGSQILFRSLEEHAVEKIRGLTLAGAVVDQIEELEFEEGENLWNELGNRLSDDRGPRKMIAIANPAGLDHWIYDRWLKDPEKGYADVHFTLYDNAANLPAEYIEDMEGMREKRPQWYRTFVLGEWGALQDVAYQLHPDHLIDQMMMPMHWHRVEGMDYGISNPTAWLFCAVDDEDNLIFYDEVYEPALPEEMCVKILARRKVYGSPAMCVGDKHSLAVRTGRIKMGQHATIRTEFAEFGVGITPGNDDLKSAYVRIRTLMERVPERRFPMWHEKRGEYGAPRMYIVESKCPHLVSEIRSAPLEPFEKRDGGERVEVAWERRRGHAHAALRYLALSRPVSSDEVVVNSGDPRRDHLRDIIRREQADEELADELGVDSRDMADWHSLYG